MLTASERRFVETHRVARLATTDGAGVPHVVPVCFALCADGTRVLIAIDGKPKRGAPRELKRVRNILACPTVALVVDRYEEDWSRLGWAMLRGRAELIEPGAAGHAEAQALLRARYPQYRTMAIDGLPVIAVTIERVTSWGLLDAALRVGGEEDAP